MARGTYEVMKLAFADVVKWKQILQEIRTGEKYFALSYSRARQAVRAYHQSGNRDALRQVAADLRSQAAASADERVQRQARNNAEVLESYEDNFASPYRALANPPVTGFETYTLEWGGLIVTGRPHLTVRNRRGRDKHLYLLTSKGWTAKEKLLAVGLLGEILQANLPGTLLRDVEGIDCRDGKRIVRSSGLSSNERSRIDAVADRLVALGLE